MTKKEKLRLSRRRSAIKAAFKDVKPFADRIAPVYKELGWEWIMPRSIRVPTKKDIVNKCNKMLTSLLKDIRYYKYCISGGITVVVEEKQDAFSVKLRFNKKS